MNFPTRVRANMTEEEAIVALAEQNQKALKILGGLKNVLKEGLNPVHFFMRLDMACSSPEELIKEFEARDENPMAFINWVYGQTKNPDHKPPDDGTPPPPIPFPGQE